MKSESSETVIVTGSNGFLGSHLVKALTTEGFHVIGIDLKPGPETTFVCDIRSRESCHKIFQTVKSLNYNLTAVFHAAALHRPQIETHTRQDFIATNVTGTNNLLEECVEFKQETHRCPSPLSFVFTSTTSVYGTRKDKSKCHWVTEELKPDAHNIYSITKVSAEQLCELYMKLFPSLIRSVVLRTSRFFEDANLDVVPGVSDANSKLNELVFRRAHVSDMVQGHLLAKKWLRKESCTFEAFNLSGPVPFAEDDVEELYANAPAVLERYFPGFKLVYKHIGYRMYNSIDRVYISEKASKMLGYQPRVNFLQELTQHTLVDYIPK